MVEEIKQSRINIVFTKRVELVGRIEKMKWLQTIRD